MVETTAAVYRYRCTYCESQIPWDVRPDRLGLRDSEEPVPGRVYPFADCPCGLGKFVRLDAPAPTGDAEPGSTTAPKVASANATTAKATTAKATTANATSAKVATAAKVAAADYRRLPIAAVRPNPAQPRKFFDADRIRGLAASINNVGLLEDILVRPVGDHFEIVLGERRWRASQVAGVAEISAKIVDLDDEEVRQIAITENIHREDLTAVEEAFSFKAYVDGGEEISSVGDAFGGMQQRVAERLKILNSHHYIDYQQQEIDELTEKVRELRQRLREADGRGRYTVAVVGEAELPAHLAEGFDVAVTLPDGRYAVRRRD